LMVALSFLNYKLGTRLDQVVVGPNKLDKVAAWLQQAQH